MTSPNPDHAWRLTLTLLGIGGAFDADLGLANTNALVEIFEGQALRQRLLIDCGHTCGRQLHHLGLTYKDIDAVLITHAHGDHIDGLEVAGYKNFFLYQHRAALISPAPILEQLWQSLAPKMQCLQLAPGVVSQADLSSYFDPRPCGDHRGGEATLIEGALRVRFVAVPHVEGMAAFALLFSFGPDPQAPTLRWSGDTTFEPGGPLFADLSAERGDRVFHDCSFMPRYEATVHTHLDELMTLPEATRPLVALVHHGKVTQGVERRGDMEVCQPLQQFTWSW